MFKDITGQEFGYLKVLEKYGVKDRAITWKCKCICGRITIVQGIHLRKKNRSIKSCGCMKGNIIHGLSYTPEYRVWLNMHQRCYNKNDTSYSDYGNRGIKVCQEWHLFENFYRDMGKRYSDKHTLERLNVHGDYCNDNCVWATWKEQNNNKTTSRCNQ